MFISRASLRPTAVDGRRTVSWTPTMRHRHALHELIIDFINYVNILRALQCTVKSTIPFSILLTTLSHAAAPT